ncbi:MAG: 2-C-methyl-D-erythritol 4-phosphate cytidylyltransferase [Pyrinomonadaceae bacterium]
MNTALIVAAGSGKRFESDTPKQFLDLLGKPVIFHTLDRFVRADSIDNIVVVLAADRMDWFDQAMQEYPLGKATKTVEGGKTRAESVRNGFRAVPANTEYIAIHDAARPLVSVQEIERTIEGAQETGAACLTSPVIDTIKKVKGKRITATIDRTALRRAVTPQIFRYEILREALSDSKLDENVTDECYLVEMIGGEIAFVEGSSRNIKITVPDDLIIAEALLRSESSN